MSVLLQIASPVDSLSSELNLGSLQEPEAVPFTFSTIGWPILGGVLLVLIFLILYLQIRKYNRNKYRREALTELQNISTGQVGLSHALVLVKRTAIHAFGRDQVGKLTGVEWLQFLDNNAKQVEFITIQKEVFELIYKGEIPVKPSEEKILINAKNWILYHAAR